MKIKIIALVAGMALSAIAGAAEFTNTETNKGVNAISTTDCALLSEDVSVSLSASVLGGYACDAGTNVIAVSMCHPNGRKTAEGYNNYYTMSSAGGKVDRTDDAACAAAAASTLAGTAAAATTGGGGGGGDGPPPAD